jgi:large subunit ribosomal protein L15
VKLHELSPAPGSRSRKHRVGRGIAGKGGKTAGRGTKGQKARDTVPTGFEGGQLPLVQRIPKLRGFDNPFRVEYRAVELARLGQLEGSEFTLAQLVELGIVHRGELAKVLGGGPLDRKIRVEAHAFSASAKAAIEAAGGEAVVAPKPFRQVRPPAAGNALANR